MPDWIFDIIRLVIGGVLGSLLTYLSMRWQLKQDRKTELAKKRAQIYSEGLNFVYNIEKNQSNAEELENILERWSNWYPSNSIYLPPLVNEVLFSAIFLARPVSNNLHNEGKVDPITWKKLKEELKNVKSTLMDSKDIGWLPDDLK